MKKLDNLFRHIRKAYPDDEYADRIMNELLLDAKLPEAPIPRRGSVKRKSIRKTGKMMGRVSIYIINYNFENN